MGSREDGGMGSAHRVSNESEQTLPSRMLLWFKSNLHLRNSCIWAFIRSRLRLPCLATVVCHKLAEEPGKEWVIIEEKLLENMKQLLNLFFFFNLKKKTYPSKSWIHKANTSLSSGHSSASQADANINASSWNPWEERGRGGEKALLTEWSPVTLGGLTKWRWIILQDYSEFPQKGMPAAPPFIAHSPATLLPILYQERLERHPPSQRRTTASEEHNILERNSSLPGFWLQQTFPSPI